MTSPIAFSSSIPPQEIPAMTQGIIADPDATERAASLKDTSLPADKASISAQAQELAARTQAASTTATEQRRASLNITEPPIEYREGTKTTLRGGATSGTLVEVSRKESGQSAPADPPIEGAAIPAEERNTVENPASAYETTLTRKNAPDLTLSFADTVVIQEAADGTTSVYYKEFDMTRTYGADGTVFQETAGNTLTADAASIIINVTAGSVHGGNGDNLVFNWANDTTITTGDGNDTIILADDVSNVSIATGGGNDSLSGNVIRNASIDLGEGDNLFQAALLENSFLRTGNGNNTVQGTSLVLTAKNSTLAFGDGNNTLYSI